VGVKATDVTYRLLCRTYRDYGLITATAISAIQLLFSAGIIVAKEWSPRSVRVKFFGCFY